MWCLLQEKAENGSARVEENGDNGKSGISGSTYHMANGDAIVNVEAQEAARLTNPELTAGTYYTLLQKKCNIKLHELNY